MVYYLVIAALAFGPNALGKGANKEPLGKIVSPPTTNFLPIFGILSPEYKTEPHATNRQKISQQTCTSSSQCPSGEFCTQTGYCGADPSQTPGTGVFEAPPIIW